MRKAAAARKRRTKNGCAQKAERSCPIKWQFRRPAAEVENVGHVWVADDGVQLLHEVCCARGVVKPKRDES